MKPFFSQLCRVAGVLLGGSLTATQAWAQAPAAAMTLSGETGSAGLAYAGPRYPGGPDSLRAAVNRQLRPTTAAGVGAIFLRLKLDTTGAVQQAEYLLPPVGGPAAALVRNPEVQALATRLVRQLPRWQPGPPAPGTFARRPETVTLRLPVGEAEAGPLVYSDENPTFPVPPGLLSRQVKKNGLGLMQFAQMQFRYPADDLRARREGTAYGYFEVNETGAIEHQQVIGSLSPTIDAELLRVLQLLPAASTPPRQQGRPVRVYYVVPIKLRLQ